MGKIDRRDAIKRTAMLMGGAVSAPAFLSVLNGCSPAPGIDWTPAYFTKDQAILITEIAEGIIPKTDTPGAKEAGVPKFIEDYVSKCFTADQQDDFLNGLAAFNATAEERMGEPYLELSPEKRKEYLLFQNDEMLKAQQTNEVSPSFFWSMKEATVLGYFTSEIGATQVLQYRPIPGEYKGCVPLEEIGKTWATA